MRFYHQITERIHPLHGSSPLKKGGRWRWGIFCSLFLFPACASKKELRPDESWLMQLNFVQAVGIALPDAAIENPKKRKKNSYKKAKKMAQEELSNILLGLTLMDGRPLKARLSENEKLMKKFKKLLKSAEKVEKNWTGGEGCVIKLRMNKKFLERKLAVQFK